MPLDKNAGPYPFTINSLEPSSLAHGSRETLQDFLGWQAQHETEIARHASLQCNELERARHATSISQSMLGRFRRNDADANKIQEIEHFGIINLGEYFGHDQAKAMYMSAKNKLGKIAVNKPSKAMRQPTLNALSQVIAEFAPTELYAQELGWLEERYKRLYRILPKQVLESGGIGKAFRTTAGVLAIAAYDVKDEPYWTRQEHLRHVLPAAYAYGATYPIVDDTLQDMPNYFKKKDRENIRDTILYGLQSGNRLTLSNVPDHPLVDELITCYEIVRNKFPYERFRHLYQAAESMFLAQEQDSARTVSEMRASDIAVFYPDIMVKAALSRVIANILGRRETSDDFYFHCMNSLLRNQFEDDFFDRIEDAKASRATPFTAYRSTDSRNPLYDWLSYDSYVANRVYNNPGVATILARNFASRMLVHMSKHHNLHQESLAIFGTNEVTRSVLKAAKPVDFKRSTTLLPGDLAIRDKINESIRSRENRETDVLTYVSDLRPFIDGAILELQSELVEGDLSEVIAYATDGGKRLRPALCVILAEAIGIDKEYLKPLLYTVELMHAASLVFDDLPAQDNASKRHGKPATHIRFGEARAQLAGIAMFSLGFAALTKLRAHFSSSSVHDVIAYAGEVTATLLANGQDKDLSMSSGHIPGTEEAILSMYEEKTSSMIQAALVSVLLLKQAPPSHIKATKAFSKHAGIVYQLRDDILDATSTSDDLGKDANQDKDKTNIARCFGLNRAEELLDTHMQSAISSLVDLPFDTSLLKQLVNYFATRKK